jgi:two-component system, OmpR family, response regulator ResD
MNEIKDDERRRDEVRHADGAADPRAEGSAGGTAGRQVILLVEDTEADRDVYGGLLWYNGYDVVHVGDGPSAMERALELQPDLILLDIILPGELDGLEVARRLRARGMKTPIIALSAHSSDEFGDRVEDARVDAYLEKPIDPFSVVREVIRRVGLARTAGDD